VVYKQSRVVPLLFLRAFVACKKGESYLPTLLHISALKWPSLRSTDTFCEKSQQNTCPDANIRLKNVSLLLEDGQFRAET
jgi:hypothetical protein